MTCLCLLMPRQAIDTNTIKDVCTKYIYNRAPAIAAVGTCLFFIDVRQDACGNVLQKAETRLTSCAVAVDLYILKKQLPYGCSALEVDDL